MTHWLCGSLSRSAYTETAGQVSSLAQPLESILPLLRLASFYRYVTTWFILWMTPPEGEHTLCVEEARVLWSKDYEFGLELRHMFADDRQWLTKYLELAERRNSFRNLAQPPSKEDLAARPLALPLRD